MVQLELNLDFSLNLPPFQSFIMPPVFLPMRLEKLDVPKGDFCSKTKWIISKLDSKSVLYPIVIGKLSTVFFLGGELVCVLNALQKYSRSQIRILLK